MSLSKEDKDFFTEQFAFFAEQFARIDARFERTDERFKGMEVQFNELARMVAEGFAHNASKAELREVETRLAHRIDHVEGRVDGVSKQLGALVDVLGEGAVISSVDAQYVRAIA